MDTLVQSSVQFRGKPLPGCDCPPRGKEDLLSSSLWERTASGFWFATGEGSLGTIRPSCMVFPSLFPALVRLAVGSDRYIECAQT